MTEDAVSGHQILLKSTIWGGGLEAGGQDKVSADLGKTVELLFDCLL